VTRRAVARRSPPAVGSGGRDDTGSSAAELVLVLPALMLVVALVMQVILWALASHAVQASASTAGSRRHGGARRRERRRRQRQRPVADPRTAPRGLGDERRALRRVPGKRVNARGSATAELVICTPVLVLISVLALALGRLVLDQSQVVDVARNAAEAASIWPTAGGAKGAAALTASYELVHDGLHCIAPDVSVDTTDLVPGGEVSVAITCVVQLSSVAVPGVPGFVTLHASAVAPVEQFREAG
jgi:Flp pilus assembly protein TadG